MSISSISEFQSDTLLADFNEAKRLSTEVKAGREGLAITYTVMAVLLLGAMIARHVYTTSTIQTSIKIFNLDWKTIHLNASYNNSQTDQSANDNNYTMPLMPLQSINRTLRIHSLSMAVIGAACAVCIFEARKWMS